MQNAKKTALIISLLQVIVADYAEENPTYHPQAHKFIYKLKQEPVIKKRWHFSDNHPSSILTSGDWEL